MPVPHQPPNNIPLASSLPKVSFRKIPLEEAQQLAVPPGVQDQAHVSFGFNDGSDFEKPEHYLRHVEPIDSDLNRQVEYDMDEQDQEWLDALNMDRRRDQLDTISYEVFEIIIDRLEKEWFDLMKRIPAKPFLVGVGPDGEPLADANEDIACAICDDGECENSNAIVFCDGCNLAVHQDCYGIPYIPEGQWLCRKCTVSPDRAVACILCPHEGGAFKQTTQGKWAHLLCAMWIPETGVSNPVYMEPIDSVERIPKARWKLQCYLCNRRMGACIQCDNRSCFTAFHVTCARKAGFLLKSQRLRVAHTPDEEQDESGDQQLRAWCHRHLPKSLRAQRAREEEFQDAHSQPPSPSPESPDRRRSAASLASPGKKKSARAYKKSYRSGPTLVPAYIIDRLLDYIARIPVRKKQQLAQQIAKFWSLKREARRGAPLLKRLHLEPWTTNSSAEQSDAERLQKLQFLLRLREDLEKVRMLAELTRKREKEKQRQLQVIRSTLVHGILFPFHTALRSALDRIMALDRSSVFLNPVSAQKVPDYYDIIKRPMDWSTISSKLDEYRYSSVETFNADVQLVLENAMIYNKVDTLYHRTAARILKVAEPIFAELEAATLGHGILQHQLELEPDQQTVDLLDDYKENGESPRKGTVQNAISDLMRHYYEIESAQVKNNRTDAISARKAKQAAAERKASEKEARSERSRIAYVTRRENERIAAEKRGHSDASGKPSDTSAHADIGSPRLTRRTSQRGVAADRSGAVSIADSSSDLTDAPSRRQSASSSSSQSTQREVGSVGNRASFKLFNVGWVLPDGMKRSRSRPDMMGAPRSELDLPTGFGNPRKRSLSSVSVQSQEKRRRRDDMTEEQEVPISRYGKKGAKAVRSTQQVTSSADSRSRTSQRFKGRQQDVFPDATLCWAKLRGYPFFPAELVDADDDKSVPTNVLKQRPESAEEVEQRSAADGDDDFPAVEQHRLVRFFDAKRTYGWVAASNLKLLFDNDDDDERLARAPKENRHRREIRQALDWARDHAN